MANQSHYAEVNGFPVYGHIRLRFEAPTTFTVDATFTGGLRQFVGLRAPKRKVRIGEQAAERVLIADTSDFPLVGEIVARRPPFELVIYNAWSGSHGGSMMWIGNAGLRLEESAHDHVVLAGNAGPSPLEFKDLRLTVAWPSTTPCELKLPEPPSAAPA